MYETVQPNRYEYAEQVRILKEKPRDTKESIFNKSLLHEIIASGLYIGLVLELIGFFIGGAIICALISLSLCKSYKGSCGLKIFVEVVAYIYIVLFLFTLVMGVLSFV